MARSRRIIEAIMLRRFLPVFVIVWLQAASAWAADPARHITQYAHTAWRMEDGAFNSAPFTIVQMPDGYMWIGTADGVLQFDGVHFVRWTPGQGQRLPNSEVLRLRTTRDGSVWISAVGSLSRWKGHTLPNYATGSRGVPGALADDNDGKVWLGQNRAPQATGTLCQVRDTGLRCLGPGDGIPSFNAKALLADRDGTLWIGGSPARGQVWRKQAFSDGPNMSLLRPPTAIEAQTQQSNSEGKTAGPNEGKFLALHDITQEFPKGG